MRLNSRSRIKLTATPARADRKMLSLPRCLWSHDLLLTVAVDLGIHNGFELAARILA
jgi:hypothetical protein